LKPNVYYPGNIVVPEGQINNTMYVLHRGSVEAYVQGETFVEVLEDESFFGMVNKYFIISCTSYLLYLCSFCINMYKIIPAKPTIIDITSQQKALTFNV
jgi:hypothetical protein